MNEFHFETHDREGSIEAESIRKGLIEYNNQFIDERARNLLIAAKLPNGELVAGLDGHTQWGWLFVKRLWVHRAHRSNGMGAKLLKQAEDEAVKRGCQAVWLDTFSFQARGFYEKLGYSVFGQLDEFPRGHKRFFLWKRLELPGA